MTEDSPVNIQVLHGDDLLALREALVALTTAGAADPSASDLNVERFSGKDVRLDDVQNAAYALPFFSARRVVVLDDPLKALTNKALQERFIRLLEGLPPTTLLVLVIHDEFFKRGDTDRRGWQAHGTARWLFEWLKANKEKASVRTFQLPDEKQMPSWIIGCVKGLGGEIKVDAATELAVRTANDTLTATQEVEKLLLYVSSREEAQRTITLADVQAVSVSGDAPSKFYELTNAMLAGQVKPALKHLRALLEEQDGAAIFNGIVRHFRQLIVTREIKGEGGTAEAVRNALGISDAMAWMVERNLIPQAMRFKPAELRALYWRLLEIDVAAKTSKSSYELSLEMLIVELKKQTSR